MNEEILSVLKEINEKLDEKNNIKILGVNKNAATELLKSDGVNSIKNFGRLKIEQNELLKWIRHE